MKSPKLKKPKRIGKAARTPDATAARASKRPTTAFAIAVARGLRRAARAARKTARMHGTPLYIWKDGKVVAIQP